MSRDIERRLAKLEQSDQDATVREISDLMDELSDKAAGGDGKLGGDSDLLIILEGSDDATS